MGLLLFAGGARAQAIDVVAVTRYWKITAGLRQNLPLTDQVWQDFPEIPGNTIYGRGIYSAASLQAYRRAIEVAYMPRYDSLRRAKLQANVCNGLGKQLVAQSDAPLPLCSSAQKAAKKHKA